MLIKIKIGIAITLLAVLAFLVWQNRALIERGARQAATIVQQTAELQDKEKRITDLARQREAAEKIAAREKARSIEIHARVKDLRDEILRMERSMEDVLVWADTALPAELDRLLLGAPDDPPD